MSKKVKIKCKGGIDLSIFGKTLSEALVDNFDSQAFVDELIADEDINIYDILITQLAGNFGQEAEKSADYYQGPKIFEQFEQNMTIVVQIQVSRGDDLPDVFSEYSGLTSEEDMLQLASTQNGSVGFAKNLFLKRYAGIIDFAFSIRFKFDSDDFFDEFPTKKSLEDDMEFAFDNREMMQFMINYHEDTLAEIVVGKIVDEYQVDIRKAADLFNNHLVDKFSTIIKFSNYTPIFGDVAEVVLPDVPKPISDYLGSKLYYEDIYKNDTQYLGTNDYQVDLPELADYIAELNDV